MVAFPRKKGREAFFTGNRPLGIAQGPRRNPYSDNRSDRLWPIPARATPRADLTPYR
jgi:hypothetical protein